ncbi:MAG: FprA family A-type flavoprotein, partial [Lachnospiraceae bacterium]
MKKLTEHVSYVGVQNPSMRTFDIIMKTGYGSSYNSYVVRGEKTAVIETAHADYGKEFLANIEEILPAEKVDYVILNHTEPDHTGSLVTLLDVNPEIEVYGTVAAIRNVEAITNRKLNSHSVKTGEILDLGQGITLEFIVSPNLHWPDSMFTYFEKEQVLFSCDVFGSHYCEPEVLDCHV